MPVCKQPEKKKEEEIIYINKTLNKQTFPLPNLTQPRAIGFSYTSFLALGNHAAYSRLKSRSPGVPSLFGPSSDLSTGDSSISLVSAGQNKSALSIGQTERYDQCLLRMSAGLILPGMKEKAINPEAIASRTR